MQTQKMINVKRDTHIMQFTMKIVTSTFFSSCTDQSIYKKLSEHKQEDVFDQRGSQCNRYDPFYLLDRNFEFKNKYRKDFY